MSAWNKFASEKMKEGKSMSEAAKLWKEQKGIKGEVVAPTKATRQPRKKAAKIVKGDNSEQLLMYKEMADKAANKGRKAQVKYEVAMKMMDKLQK